ncbi:hypothetical protein SUGI_0005060 [Cryptomeria japonica]|nr:hypothetical protein SUGI_0005060 [Cryptomeria japonica]
MLLALACFLSACCSPAFILRVRPCGSGGGPFAVEILLWDSNRCRKINGRGKERGKWEIQGTGTGRHRARQERSRQENGAGAGEGRGRKINGRRVES